MAVTRSVLCFETYFKPLPQTVNPHYQYSL